MDPSDTDGDGDHADVTARLHTSLAGPSLDPATRQRHLDAIRARAAALPTPTPTPAPAPVTAAGGLARRLASTVTATGLVVVLGASGAVAAAHDTLPGQALYPVKHVTEQVVLAAPLSPGRAVERHLAFAGRRLDEAAALADRDVDPDLVAEALTAHARLMAQASGLAHDHAELAAQVDTATRRARQRLAQLLDRDLPPVAADRARAALSAADARLDRRHAVPPAPAPSAPGTVPQDQPRAPRPHADPPAPAPAPDRGPTPREGGPAPAPHRPAPADPHAAEPREQDGQQPPPSQPVPTTPRSATPAPGREERPSSRPDRAESGHGQEPPAEDRASDRAPADGRTPSGRGAQ